jgi:hypothetical protein
MCEPITMSAMAAASIAGGVAGAVGSIQKGNYEAAVARNNARVAKWQATDAARRGSEEAAGIRAEASRAGGTAMAQAGSSGVDVSSGSMANIFAAGAAEGAADAETAKYNATLEAWGYRNQSRELTARAKMIKRESVLSAFGSGLQGVGGAIGAFKK